MNNLYFRSSFGRGTTLDETGSIQPISIFRGFDDFEFETKVWGRGINPREAKSELYPCRNLLANISGVYVGKNRGNLPAAHLDDACKSVDKDGVVKDLVIIEHIGVDTSSEPYDIAMLYANIYEIVSYEIMHNYATSKNLVICLLDCDGFKSTPISSNVKYKESDNYIIFMKE